MSEEGGLFQPFLDRSVESRVMDAIEYWWAMYGKSPTLHEIQEFAKYPSGNGVNMVLDNLESMGYITRVPMKNRNIRLTAKRYFI